MPAVPSPELIARVERVAGARAVAWTPVTGGCTLAARWIARFSDTTSAFVKAAQDDDTARWLRAERFVYERLSGPMVPRYLGWDEDGVWPLMLLEDLSGAGWAPPWTGERVDQVLTALGELRRMAPPDGLPGLESAGLDGRDWAQVAEAPDQFLSLGLCSREWLQSALPALMAAEAAAVLRGEELLHCDVRSDNLCFRDGRAVFVDWNHACVGNAQVDIAAWLPSLHAEGGPPPEAVLPGEGPVAALLAGYWALRAGRAAPASGPRVRQLQLMQLRVALPWAARELGLPGIRC